jgi:hypothetical protein
MKKCKGCGNEYPDTSAYFPPRKNCKNGRNPRCRTCVLAQQRAWKKKNGGRLAEERRKQYAERYGAIARENERRRMLRKPYAIRAKLMRNGMSARSKAKGLPFDGAYFTSSRLVDWFLQTPACPCCGVALDYGYKFTGCPANNSPSIDRLWPERGYVQGNVAILCWRCNNLKRDATPEELEKVVAWMKTARGEVTE